MAEETRHRQQAERAQAQQRHDAWWHQVREADLQKDTERKEKALENERRRQRLLDDDERVEEMRRQRDLARTPL